MEGNDQDKCQGSDGSRKCDAEVLTEFILHSTSLTVAGCDGCIGDEREIISKHGTADDRCDAKGQRETRGLRYGSGNRNDQGDGSNGGSHGGRDKARYHKENSNGKTGRDKRQHQISNAFSTASSNDNDKRSGCQQDEKHGDDVLISDALPHQLQFPVKGKRTVLETIRKHKCDNNRNVVKKAHRDLSAI